MMENLELQQKARKLIENGYDRTLFQAIELVGRGKFEEMMDKLKDKKITNK